MAAKLSPSRSISSSTARSALMRSWPMRRSTPRTKRDLPSMATCASSRYPISSAAVPGRFAALLLSFLSCFSERSTAWPKRSSSAGTSEDSSRRSGTTIVSSSET